MHKTVLYISVARNAGGLERRFAALYAHFVKNGAPFNAIFRVSRAQTGRLEAFRQPGREGSVLRPFGLPDIIIGRRGMAAGLLRLADYLALAVILLLDRKTYDAVHFVTPSALLFRRLVKARIRVASFVDSMHTERQLRLPAVRDALRRGYRFDILSRSIRDRITAETGAAGPGLMVAPCSFIDYSRTRIGRKKPMVAFVARLEAGKGVPLLLELLPSLGEIAPDVMLRIVGEGSLKSRIADAAIRCRLNGRVTVGALDEPTEVLKESMVFLSLQSKENYPSQALIEAMACGNAVIATDVGATREIVTPDTGILVTDADGLAAALCELFNDRGRTLEMGRRARERVMNEHTVERFVRYLKDVYAA